MISAWGSLPSCSFRDPLPSPLTTLSVTLRPTSKWRREMGRQKEGRVTGEQMRLYMGSGGNRGSQCPAGDRQVSRLNASSHPNGSAHSPPDRAGPPRQMLKVRGQGGMKGVLSLLWPPCASHRLLTSLCEGAGPQSCQGTHLPVVSQDIKLSTYSAAHPSQNNSSCLQREGAEIIKGSRWGG